MSSLKASVAYYGHTSDKNELTGLAVSLPYGDAEFYSQMKRVYKGIGLDSDYIDWLGRFVSKADDADYYDFGEFEDEWDGWADYESEYGCNISGGGSCEYGYDYADDNDAYFDYDSEDSFDDWIYDYDAELWYMYDGDLLYLYDDESDMMGYYDEYEDEIYYYDEDKGDWLLLD